MIEGDRSLMRTCFVLHPSGMCLEVPFYRGVSSKPPPDRTGKWGSVLDSRAKKIIFSRAAVLWRLCGYSMFFYTFTLPIQQFTDDTKKEFRPGYSDKDVGRIFSTVLENLTKRHNLGPYVWVAEIQNKTTKNIHYHLLCGVRLNPVWLSGYFAEFFGVSDNRNCVDIKPIHGEARQVASYMASYMSKEGNSRNIYTRKHGSTRGLTYKPLKLASVPAGLKTEREFSYEINGQAMRGIMFDTRQTLTFFPIDGAKDRFGGAVVDNETGEILT